MARKNHHTKRLLNARKKAIEKWRKHIIDSTKDKPSVFDRPIKEECIAFVTGYNMGYKKGREHVLSSKSQESKWKPVLDALCRFKDPISFKQAIKILHCTEKALHKHIGNFEYYPTSEDLRWARRQNALDDLDNMRF